MTFFKDIFQEPNSDTFCPIRLIGIGGSLQGLACSAYDVFIQHHAFDLMAFGGGLGATIAAVGIALGMKKDAPSENK